MERYLCDTCLYANNCQFIAKHKERATGCSAYINTFGVSVDRIRELCAAERDGRCVVLPCKVGDSVWDRFGYHWTIIQIEFCMVDRIWFRCGNKGTNDHMAFSDEDIEESIFLKESEGNAAKERWEKECAAILSKAALAQEGGQDDE